MSRIEYEEVTHSDWPWRGFAGACRRLRKNTYSLVALKFVELILAMMLTARFSHVVIKDAAAFVEGMRHNTHLQGLWYVHMPALRALELRHPSRCLH